MAESPVKSSTENSPGLLRSSSVVSVMTLVSRVLGLIRDVVVAQYFGARADGLELDDVIERMLTTVL